MLRSLRLLCPGRPQRAFSALTGNSYPPSIASKLGALGFQSDLWLTEKQMSAIGVEVAPEHKNKGYAMQSGSGITFSLYNASQTTDLGRVEKMKGRLAVFNALTRERIRGNAETCLQEHHGKFTSNEWLSDRDIDMLCMKLKPDAKPISVTYEFDDTVIGADGTTTTETRKVTRGYYNIDQVEDAEILVRSRKVMPISASTGRRYHGTAMHVLLRRSIESGYDSPFWITMQGAQALGLLIKNPSAGVEINAGENRIVTLYNACETTDPQKVSSAAYNAKFSARSAVSGAVYPPESQAHLKAASTKNGYRSVYWLSKKQASILGVSIRDGEHPTSITTDTGVVELYNADQTNDKSIVESRFGARS